MNFRILIGVTICIVIGCMGTASSAFGSQWLYASDADTQTLHRIDPTNGHATQVGPFNVSGYMAGLAYDANHDVLYGTTTDTDNLFSISYTTGNATYIGSLGATLMHALAYDNVTDTLFGMFGFIGGDGLYEIDVNTGQSTLIGHTGHFFDDPFDTVHGLAVHPHTGVLYGVVGGPSSLSGLVQIDKTTGAAVLLHQYDIANMSGLAFGSDGTLYAMNNWDASMYTINLHDGSTQFVGNTQLGNALGLCFVPEPASAVLVLLGPLLLACRCREK